MSEIIFFEPKGTLFLKDLFDDISKDIYKIKIFDINIREYPFIIFNKSFIKIKFFQTPQLFIYN